MKYRFVQFFFLFLILFCYSTISFAQTGTLSGTVKSSNGKPISDATVILKNTDKNALTNEKGQFSFASVEYGKYEIDVISIGVKRLKFHVHLHKDSKPVVLTVDPAEFSLEEVSVTSESKKKKIETEGYSVNVIETKDIALQSIQTNELLGRAAGVKVRQNGGLGSHIHYNINGMTGSSVKIFIDGVPSTNYGQSFSLNSIAPAMIERIEVYKGVVPGYLSEDALGGAINIVLKQNRKNLLSMSYSYGSFNTHQYNVNGSYRGGKGFAVDVLGFYNYSDNDYKVWGEDITFRNYQGVVTSNQKAKRFHDGYESYGTKVDVGWDNVIWADRFRIGGVLSHDYNEIQNGITMQRVFGDRHSKDDARIATLAYRKDNLLAEGLSLSVDASYSRLKTQIIDTVGIMYDWRGPILYPDGTPVKYTSGAELGSDKTAEKNIDKTFVVRTNVGYQLNDQNKVYVNYLFNNFKRDVSDKFLPAGLQPLQNTRDLQKNIVAITYENLSFSDRLRTNVFYKYYNQKVTLNEPYKTTTTPPKYEINKSTKKEDYNGFGAAVSFALFPKLFLMASAEKAIRFPNEKEIFGSAASNLNPGDVHAEKSFNANFGVNLGTFVFDKHSFRLNTSLFYRDTEGMIREAMSSGNSGTSYYENLEDVLSKGIDAEFGYSYDEKINLSFNISKFDVLFNTKYNKEGAEYLYYRKQIRNEPSLKYNANISYLINNLFIKRSHASVYYNISYVESFLRNWSNIGSTNLDRIPVQYASNVGLAFTFPSPRITVSFDAKNIFNRQMFDNFGLQKPGRAFYGKITYNIF